MAWIRSDQNLRNHPKLRVLMDKLGISKAESIGYLHMLWWWCVDYFQTGDIRANDSAIAEGAMWSGDPRAFVSALIDAGFLERSDGVLAVHDWLDYCGDVVEKRLKRLSEKRSKTEKLLKSSRNSHVMISADNGGQTADNGGLRYDTIRYDTNTKCPPTSGGDRFGEFWQLWPKDSPRKSNEAGCRKKWILKNLDKEADEILRKLKAWKVSKSWTEENGHFIPLPMTWLNQRRWEAPAPEPADKSLIITPPSDDVLKALQEEE